ncbi:MAG: hypothetical protein L6R36_008621 [Xanthoria steineri]|nr:MAG: hypothetical protein L6R36_008621 [Xanthoria steineri]
MASPRRLLPALVVYLLAIYHALTLPVVPPGGRLAISTNVATDPNPTSLGIPPYFTLHTEVLDPRALLDSGVVSIIAVLTLEELCFNLRQSRRIEGEIRIPGGDTALSLVSDEQPPYRFAAWAVQRIFEEAHRLHYASITSSMEWHGSPVGQILLQRDASSLTKSPEVAGGNSTLKADDSVPSSVIVPAGLGARHELRLLPGYTGIDMPMFDVMLTILKVMVMGVENGPEAICQDIVMPHFILRPERGAMGQPVLRWGQVIKMMRVLARWLVAQNRYGEVSFMIKRDGALVAIGTIRRV